MSKNKYEKFYVVKELTNEGRLVDLEVPEGYGYVKSYSWRKFDTEEEALEEVSKDTRLNNIVILPMWREVDE